MMKIVILGSSGLLGSALRRELAKKYRVIGWDRSEGDLTDFKRVREHLNELNPDFIINAAAYNGVDLAEQDNQTLRAAELLNRDLVAELAQFSARKKIPLMHFSTDYVFDGTNKNGYTETAPVHPLNKYGITKVAGEEVLQRTTKQFYLIRLSRLFGPPGTSPQAKKSFVDLMLELGKKNPPGGITLVNEETSSPTYSQDLACFVARLIAKKAPYGIYHAANSGACSWYELAAAAFRIKKIPVPLTAVPSAAFPRPARRPLFSELLNTKEPPIRPWREALEDYLSGK